MAQTTAPSPFQVTWPFVDSNTFGLTEEGFNHLYELWRQVVAGFVNVPCNITQASINVIQLDPVLNIEGANAYGNGMIFSGKIVTTTTGAVTGRVGKKLSTVKFFKNNGLTQAGIGDLIAGGLYLFIYEKSLNAGAGGLVIK